MKNLPSVMGNRLSRTPNIQIQRSKFDRSHGLKTTFDAGYLIPIYVDEALPGDTFNMRASVFARLATPIKPVMDNMFLDTFFFAVPNRLLWSNWEKFNGAQDDPGDSISFTVPQIPMPANGPEVHSLSDYLGLPTDIVAGYSVSSLWHRAYNLIYNTWFRDENLQNSEVVDLDDGPDTLTDYVLLRRGKRHDYFTSCLVAPQKGSAVSLPIGASSAPVNMVPFATSGAVMLLRDNAAGDPLNTENAAIGVDGAGRLQTNAIGTDIILDPNTRLITDLSSALATTVNELREAIQTQVLLERDARGGTRYTEIIKSHFGVTSPDARLQRPEYLGGGSSNINIHPVPQTGETGTTPQGNLGGFGTASFDGHGFNKAFVEHCTIIGLANVRADLNYQQGIDRQFSRSTRYDFYWPAFANIGEQSVLNKEIYAQGDANDDLVFGYQERYAEYRYKPSKITGAFRSTYATSIDYWHLAEEYSALPTLAATWIQSDPPIDRVIVTASEPHFLFDAYFRLTCARPMPVYGVPGFGSRL